jgi:tripartite-type tricarboxylate transporter receptor subunit TctC
MFPGNRQLLILTVIVAWGVFVGYQSVSMGFPDKPITMIIPYPAGGSSDGTGRALGNSAGKCLGQPVIVENKPGGGGTVGPSLFVTKPADGYSLCAFPPFGTAVAWHMGKLNFNPLDVTRIIRYTGTNYGIVVRADAPWKTIQALIKYAKANPKKVTYGSTGVGSAAHLAIEELSALSGIELVHMPYRGGAETNPALLGGHVDIVCDSTGWGPLVEAGKFRLLATMGQQRLSRYSQAPTLKEAGYDVTAMAPMEIAAPKGLPGPIVKTLHDAFHKAMNEPEFLAALKTFDMQALYLNSADSEKAARDEFEKVGKLVQRLGLNKQ